MTSTKLHSASKSWFVYICRCSDNSLYTGISTDVLKRIKTHNSGRGAKYTRSHKPVTLCYVEGPLEKGSALSREIQIKKLKRSDKLLLIANHQNHH